MLNDATGFSRIYLALGYTDLRKGIPGLRALIKEGFDMDPYQKDVLFLFCGRKTNTIKGLLFEGDGFLLLYKRLDGDGRFKWPRKESDLREITPQQYRWLMEGLSIVQKNPIRQMAKKPKYLV